MQEAANKSVWEVCLKTWQVLIIHVIKWKIKLCSRMCSVILVYIESKWLCVENINHLFLLYVFLYFSNVFQRTGIVFINRENAIAFHWKKNSILFLKGVYRHASWILWSIVKSRPLNVYNAWIIKEILLNRVNITFWAFYPWFFMML